jgi:DNA polymerase I-like protein with 3'-5' exonuclease and polymerase domains
MSAVDFTVIDIETTGSDPTRHALVAVGIGAKVYRPDEGRAMARLLLASPASRPVTVTAHTNFDLRWLGLDGASLGEGVSYHDTKVMAWMLDATQPLDLESLSVRYLNHRPPKPIHKSKGVIMFRAKGGDMRIEDVPWDEMEAYNQSDLDTERRLYEHLRQLLIQRGLWTQFLTEEAPFSRLLIEMEVEGTPFNKDDAQVMLDDTLVELERLNTALVRHTGDPNFNCGSSDQVAMYLYEEVWQTKAQFAIPRLNGLSAEEKMERVRAIAPEGVEVTKVGREYAYGVRTLNGRGLKPPPPKKVNGEFVHEKHPSVNGKILAVLHGDDEWVEHYLEWRRLDKLRGYLVDWIDRVRDGKLHPRLDQGGTVTGRLSCKEPNLQQVSKGPGVRELFQGDLFLGDYAGLEVRLSAHFSHDPLMMEVFTTGGDLYGTLAAEAWGGPATKDNPGRGLMKVVMLGTQYGARGNKLAEILAIAGMKGYTPAKANGLLKDLERALPVLMEWREEVIIGASRRGYVTTLGGRERHLAGIGSAVWATKAKAERQAVNSLVQGSAADVVRRAMLRAREAVNRDTARIILQVHDEILWRRMPGWHQETFDILKDICENGTGFDLDVPLIFEAKVAQSWADKGGSAGQIRSGEYANLQDALEAA